MKVISSLSIPPSPVTQEGAKAATIRELITDREGAPTFAMRLFEVAPGGATPFHTHGCEHEVFVLEGEGQVKTREGPAAIKAGDAVFVPPNEEHQFANTGEQMMKFLCMIPVEQPCCR